MALEALAGSGGVAFPRMTALVGPGQDDVIRCLAQVDAGRRGLPPRPRFSRRRMAFPWCSWKARPIPLLLSTMR
ncbi:MAG: hypothetical protein ACLSHC_03940 [Bilophila wadsworthia]